MDNLLAQGVELAIFGMGTVFVFLALLIAATKTMSAIVLRFEPEVVSPTPDAGAHNGSALDQGRIVAIISAAITQHRNKNKQ
ncbi:MAG: oxaloacetate decarboxylase [SAR86 cluster bacterium]|uniref:Probable oxaloacetate decarboxylase gamma chain n=1 Tax=SAR86 cluster bacterium TaxID=2030880 RepID=A0A2A5B4U6_9GAMM|nr:MAG: oxaloacetate decarboxylase [SAR86 cluster bacterium]